jgi:hypothetical protein
MISMCQISHYSAFHLESGSNYKNIDIFCSKLSPFGIFGKLFAVHIYRKTDVHFELSYQVETCYATVMKLK